MIREWRMSEFKSVGPNQRLELTPLTVLAGANSSGKSSVIQSMLLISQTLTSKVVRRHLVLNGELVKLGTFDDVLREGAERNTIGLGFTLESELTSHRVMGPAAARIYYSYSPRFEGARATISTDITFGPSLEDQREGTGKSGRLQADVLLAEFDLRLRQGAESEATGVDAADVSPELTISRLNEQEVQELLGTVSRSHQAGPGLATLGTGPEAALWYANVPGTPCVKR